MKRFVLYLDMEHPLSLQKRRERDGHFKKMRRNSSLFRQISGAACLSQSFLAFDASVIKDLPLLALIIGGNRADWKSYSPEDLREPMEAVRASCLPLLGICGGHQLVCRAFGAQVAPMRKLASGESDPDPKYKAGYFKEKGFVPVSILCEDPLFARLGREAVFHESHYCEVKDLPHSLKVLASSSECQIQVVAHRAKPIYGVQFHPESFDEEHPDGRTVLENFFALARASQSS